MKGMWVMTQGHGPLAISAVINPELSEKLSDEGGWMSILEIVCQFPSDGDMIQIEKELEESLPQSTKDQENAALCIDGLTQLSELFSVAADLIQRAYVNDHEDQK